MTSQTIGSILPPPESAWRRLGRLAVSTAVLAGSAAYVWTHNPALFRLTDTAAIVTEPGADTIAAAPPAPTPVATAAPRAEPTPAAAKPSSNPLATATGTRVANAAAGTPVTVAVANAGPAQHLPYHDGNFRGNNAYAYFGEVAVRAIVENGKLIDVKVMRYPNHRKISKDISDPALVVLRKQALERQSAQVDMVSGATWTSKGYAESLSVALAKSTE